MHTFRCLHLPKTMDPMQKTYAQVNSTVPCGKILLQVPVIMWQKETLCTWLQPPAVSIKFLILFLMASTDRPGAMRQITKITADQII